MAQRGRLPALALLAAGLTGLAGCTNVARGPDPLLGPTPTAEAIHTEAKPPSPAVLPSLDPRATRLEVRPAEAVAPTRTEQVLVATVLDAQGRPLPGRRVEWKLEGPGAIVAIDDRGRLLFGGEKTDDHNAFSFTEHFEHVVSRGAPGADFTIGHGQSWCVVSSAEEGETRVAAYAPEIGNAAANRVVVTQRWSDADWTAPQPSAGAPGSDQFLSASVFPLANHRPLAGYAVRYRILSGPPALFMPSQTAETVVVTNAAGVAPVVVSETAPQAGRTRIGVELLGKGDAVVGRGETYAEWQGPDVSLSALFLPTAAVGQEAPLTLTVNNAGAADATLLTVRTAVPDGCKFVRSDPPAFQQGDELVWTLGTVAGRNRRMLQAVFQSDRVGAITARASLTSGDGRNDEKTAVCNVTPPRVAELQVWPSGPDMGLVGGKVLYQVAVRNQGTAPATNVVLKAAFTGSLEYGEGGDSAELKVGSLAPGETKTLPLPAYAKQVGPATTRVTALADGGLAAQVDRPLTVQDARLTLRLSPPARSFVGRPAVWDVEVRNAGDAKLAQTTVSDLLPPDLVFIGATDGGRLQGREVVWNLGDLPPNGQKVLHLTTTAPRPTQRTAHTGTAVARVGDTAQVRAQAGAETQVPGLPAYKMTVVDRDDPVEVGGRTAYRVVVKNTGSLAGEQVQVTAAIPAQMRFVTASGPTTYRAEGSQVTFAPLATLPPGQTLTYLVEAEAVRSGEARFRAELTTGTMREAVVKEESTNVR
jgi:uncharacterized repeat protein (TIGR01451 family)